MSRLIGIDASRAVIAKKRGVEYYGWYVINELLKMDRVNRYRLYAPFMPTEGFGDYPNVEWKIIPAKRLWSQVHLANELRRNPPDVLYVPSHVIPLLSTIKSVVMIHDLAYKYYPKSYSRLARRYLNFATTTSAQKATRILVPSQATKKDLLKFTRGLNEKKIVVTPESYNEEIFNINNSFQDAPIDAPYVFFVSQLEHRKNVGLLIDAFALLAKESNPINLVIAGKPGYGWDEIKQKIDALPEKIRSRIIVPGYFSTYDVARYLKYAKMFVFPSQYEGFGIPILEAMAMGTPVICSNTSSLPEVAGDATVQLPPENPLTWAAAMSRILHQKGTAEEMRRKGLAQVAKFSWKKTAQQTLKILEDVASQ